MIYTVRIIQKRCSLILSPFPSRTSFKIYLIPAALHPALMVFFLFWNLRCWYISVIIFTWHGFKVDKRRSTLMVVTSRSGSFVRVSIIKDVKYHWKSVSHTFWRMCLLLGPTSAASESYSLESWQILYRNLIVYPLPLELIGS